MEQFKCDICGELTEYIGNKIGRIGEDANQLVQTVLTQSYEDVFDLDLSSLLGFRLDSASRK
jgi:hypothetical protein